RYNERVRIAGRLIADAELAALLREVREASDGIEPSFFEATTAVAVLAFARSRADACIVEVGLGGRLDATNVIEQPLVSGITSLGLDHQQFLGKRMIEIAGEKAGIAKGGTPLVTQLYPPRIARLIGDIAREQGTPWLPRGGEWDADVRRDKLYYRDKAGELALPVPRLPGRHQALNAALAVAMLRHQDKLKIPASALSAAMGWADWPARLQRMGPGPLTGLLPTGSELWVDGGHNPSASRLVADHVRHHWLDGGAVALFFAGPQAEGGAGGG